MEKENLLKLFEMLMDRIRNEDCTQDELDTLNKSVQSAINPLMTRKSAIKHFELKESTFDNEISRKLSEKDKVRNIVLYPFKKLRDIFGR